MIKTAAPNLSRPSAESVGTQPPAGWEALRADTDIQFAPVTAPPPPPPPEPGWFAQLLDRLLGWLGDLLGPVGTMLGQSWWWLQWALAGAAALFALALLVKLVDPAWFGRRRNAAGDSPNESVWEPDSAAAAALLEDADRLAAEGQYDAAVHLLLRRSIAQIRDVRPDWVEPSTTARELAALSALPDAARTAFRVIAGRVEASLFALRTLERGDWEAARSAYAQFALARIEARAAATGMRPA